jgi:excisionase family DNA binding protein
MTLDAAIRDLIREAIREELRPFREDLRALSDALQRSASSSDAPEDLFFTVEEVAATLKVNRTTVRAWINAGRLKASRLNAGGKTRRLLRIARADVDAFLVETTRFGVEREGDTSAEAARIVAADAARIARARSRGHRR